MKFKHLIFFIYTLGVMSCSITKPVNDISTGEEISLLSLKKADNQTWFYDSFNNYIVDSISLNQLPKTFNNNNNSIDIFMGTWCEDSHREVPRFIKIMEYLNFTNYRIIGLDRNKTSKKGFETNKNIVRVPTFIFYDNDKNELNRIVEYPVISLEKDICAIVISQIYQPNYSN